MCMWPKPALSEHAQWIGPTGRRRSGPNRVRPPMPNVEAYAPARPLLGGPVGLDVVRRLQRRGADDLRHPLEDELSARVEGRAPGELGLLAREKRAEDADRCRGRRVVVELAHELVRGEALSGEPIGAPEGLGIDGEDLRHAALRARLLEAHSPCRQRRREANCRGEIRRDGDDHGMRRRRDVSPRRPRRRSSDQLIERTGESSTTRSPSSSAMRSGTSCEPPTTR